MHRTILLSTLVIGAALAVVFGGTWAAFTDQTVTQGTVGAATIDIVANADTSDGDPNPVAVTYTLPDVGGLLPGEVADADITLVNAGTRAFHVTNTIGVVSSDPTNCPVTADGSTGNMVVVVTITDVEGDDHVGPVVHIDEATGADTETAEVTATLDTNAPNGCQGVTFTITITFVATGVADAA